MLHRRAGESLVIITQPAHAWISGQLAEAWGNAELGLEPVAPEVRLAAEQHDIAWLDWEAAPTLNPDTGLPRAFTQMPTLEHLALWSQATARALAYGYLPAALISMHGTYLYERFHDFEADDDEEVRAARAFLQREHDFQSEALEHIWTTHGLDGDAVREQRQLVSLWDAMSLAVCMGAPDGRAFSAVPARGGPLDLELQPLNADLTEYRLDPWPFGQPDVFLCCEARRLDGTFDDQEAMRAALRAAPTERLEFRLVAG